MSLPSSIAHYRITVKLGEGGMGEVYRATDTKLGRDVALKVIPEAFASDAERMARFAREAKVLAALNHPNIAAIYGVEECALVLELVEGPTLEKLIVQGPIPVDEALRIARQTAEALEYAHERGIVHRDLKPANIKVTCQGRVKVLDFGLAKVQVVNESDPTISMITATGAILGTASYMSPEQVIGKPMDARSDIFSFGLVLYEMLSGRRAFAEERAILTMMAILNKEARPLREVAPQTPLELDRVVSRCLSKAPAERYSDMGAVRRALEKLAKPAPSEPQGTSIAALPFEIAATIDQVPTLSITTASAKIFLSYKSTVEPDRSLAGRVFEALRQDGHVVFIDRTMTVGQEWAKEIESRIRGSDCLIVFLTAQSSQSEMVRGEVEMARDQAARTGSPRILPVRVAYAGPLPYPLNTWLDPIQYTLWRGEADTPQLIRELTAAVTGTPLSHSAISLGPAPQNGGAPLHSAPLPPPGGALDVEDERYVRRKSDGVASQLISQQGVTLVIKGSRQMGKSSLLVRTLSAAIDLGKRCALIDFQMMGQETLRNGSAFFRRFAESVADQMELRHNLSEFWDDGLSDSQNLTRYVEKHILQPLDTSFVLAIDEADILFQADFLYDFFGMLRSWHNARANPLKKKVWRRLDLVLVTSTEPYLFIDRDHESPFNVGEVLALSDFTQEQVRELNDLHDAPLFPAEVDRLYDLLHGQPYLTRKAFYAVKCGLTPERLFAQASDDGGPFGDHLRNYSLRLLNYPELATALKQVALGHGCSDGKLAYRLQGAGLVRSESGKVIPRCSLYAEYFRERL